MDKKREVFLLVGAVIVVVLVYFLFFYNSGNINSKSNSQNAINIFTTVVIHAATAPST